jgi:hypothetical protein
LGAWERPKSKGIFGVVGRGVVIDDLVGSQQRNASSKMERAVEQFCGVEVSLLKGIAQRGISDELID